eukprot:5485964-Pleurochrysis_carterae.AAC.3
MPARPPGQHRHSVLRRVGRRGGHAHRAAPAQQRRARRDLHKERLTGTLLPNEYSLHLATAKLRPYTLSEVQEA